MSLQIRIIIVIFALSLLVFIFELLRRKKFSETMVLWWLFIILTMVFLTLNQTILARLREIMGTALPISALLFLSLCFILLMLIYFSMKISVMSDQIKEIVQDLAICRAEYLENKRRDKLER